MSQLRKINSICLISNPEKELARRALPTVKKVIAQNKLTVLPRQQLAKADVIMTLGGDGTILSVASQAARLGIPVFGINLGRLGFMTTVGLGDFTKRFSSWINKPWPLSERMMLQVHLPGVKNDLLALNDAVVRIGAVTRVTRIHASIENQTLGYFIGDGLIVATSTGSTAYSLSAQGPVVHPMVDALLLTPICAHSFSQRPVVFPSQQTLELRLDDHRSRNEVQLCLDGQHVVQLKPNDVIKVTGSRYKLKLFVDPRKNYFEILREKLQWGGR